MYPYESKNDSNLTFRENTIPVNHDSLKMIPNR